MDRVHDYESCDIGSIPSMGAYFWRGGRDGLLHQS